MSQFGQGYFNAQSTLSINRGGHEVASSDRPEEKLINWGNFGVDKSASSRIRSIDIIGDLAVMLSMYFDSP